MKIKQLLILGGFLLSFDLYGKWDDRVGGQLVEERGEDGGAIEYGSDVAIRADGGGVPFPGAKDNLQREGFLSLANYARACESNLSSGVGLNSPGHQNGGGDVEALWGASLRNLLNKEYENYKRFGGRKSGNNWFRRSLSVLDGIGDKAVALARRLHECHALIVTSSYSNHGDGSVPGAGNHVEASKYNQKIRCSTSGHDTQDFQHCKRLAGTFDKVTEEFAAKESEERELRDEWAREAKGKVDQSRDQKVYLDVQGEAVKTEAAFSEEKAALYERKAEVLRTAAGEIPTKEQLTYECEQKMSGKENEYYQFLHQVVWNDFGAKVKIKIAFDEFGGDSRFRELRRSFSARERLKFRSFAAPGELAARYPGAFDASAACSNIVNKSELNLILNDGARAAGFAEADEAEQAAMREREKVAKLKGQESKIARVGESFSPDTPGGRGAGFAGGAGTGGESTDTRMLGDGSPKTIIAIEEEVEEGAGGGGSLKVGAKGSEEDGELYASGGQKAEDVSTGEIMRFPAAVKKETDEQKRREPADKILTERARELDEAAEAEAEEEALLTENFENTDGSGKRASGKAVAPKAGVKIASGGAGLKAPAPPGDKKVAGKTYKRIHRRRTSPQRKRYRGGRNKFLSGRSSRGTGGPDFSGLNDYLRNRQGKKNKNTLEFEKQSDSAKSEGSAPVERTEEEGTGDVAGENERALRDHTLRHGPSDRKIMLPEHYGGGSAREPTAYKEDTLPEKALDWVDGNKVPLSVLALLLVALRVIALRERRNKKQAVVQKKKD